MHLNKVGVILLLGLCLMGAGVDGIAAGTTKVKPKDEGFTDEMLGQFPPYLVYPDATSVKNISGTITAVFSVSGSHTFLHRPEESKYTTRTVEEYKLNMVITYSRSQNIEKVSSKVTGLRRSDYYEPPRGILSPSCRLIKEEQISGESTNIFQGTAVDPVLWSKGLQLICFPAKLGDRPDGWASHFVGVPVKIRTHDKTISGGEVTHESTYTADQMMSAILPSFGISGSRWSKAVRTQDSKKGTVTMGAWIETRSTHGNSQGFYSTRLYSRDGFNWSSEGYLRQMGWDPLKKPTDSGDITWSGNLQLVWSLGSAVPQNRMTIAPVNIGQYEQWIPSPADDERFGKPERLSFVAEIKDRDGKKDGTPGRIHFWLMDVSNEKGQCTNYPLNGKDDPDLRFAPNQAGLIIDPDNPRHAYTKDFCISAVVEVEALDTGAYGKIQATCEELGLVAEDERTGRQALSIPLDDNQNDVADAWERERGIFKYNYAANDDEDNQPARQRRNGDGYTFYEEYRGFMTKAGFVRTDPLKKDLFVYDPDGLVREWYEPYNPAKLVMHYIDPQMMIFNGVAKDPDNRWVNSNTSESKRYARQYALYVKYWTTMQDAAGEANWMELNDRLNDDIDPYHGFEQPLKEHYIVKIAPLKLERALRGIENQAVRQDVFRKTMSSTVIHEVGHALGISHHRESGEMETDESIVSGVFDCAMRYTSAAEYRHPELMKYQTRFCHEGEEWKQAEDGEFKDYPSHDCFGQIDVKSDP